MANEQTVYLVITDINNPQEANYVEIQLIVEDCNNTNTIGCFEDGYLLTACDGDTVDGHASFNLTEAHPDCVLLTIVTTAYYENLADAENAVNPIANPSSYVNGVANEQTVYYVITDINNPQDPNYVEIQLFVEDCSNTTTCSEYEIDDYLLTCIWNVVSYNNSDDLIVYDLDFNADLTVTITGNGQTITSMWSTSTNAAGRILEFSNVTLPNIQAINGNWFINDCTPDRLEMVQNQDTMVMEQDCN